MKGQASVEYVMLIGLLLVVLIPLFYYSMNKVNSEIKERRAYESVKVLADAADKVYALGSGSRLYERILVPKGILNSTIEGNEISFMTSKGDILAISNANLSGDLPIREGSYSIAIEALEGFVRIREARNESQIVCGDDVAEGLEVCDNSDLNGMTCILLGYAGGNLSCLSDCSGYNTNNCISGSLCGNSIIESGEECDTLNLNGQDCQDKGFIGGNLTCSDCRFNTTECISPSFCGNNLAEIGEGCDGSDLNSEICQSQGFDGGNLTCLGNCSGYNTTGCIDVSNCNDYCTLNLFNSGQCRSSWLCGSIFGGSHQPGGDIYCSNKICCCF